MQTYLLKADGELFARIDEAAGKGKRAEWIREACEMRLSGGGAGRVVNVADVRPGSVVERESRSARLVRSEPQAKVSASTVLASPVRRMVPKPGKRDWSGDFPAVEAVLPEHRYSVRELAKRLEWTEMKLEKVLSAMEAEGLVRFERGAVVPGA